MDQRAAATGGSRLWIFAVLSPLLTLLFAFLWQRWDWGLMDDVTILNSGAGWLERFQDYFRSTRLFGQFKPFYALHSAVFYTIFADLPKGFYIFRWLEIGLVLLIWATVAYRITGTRLAFWLVPTVTLSFHYFYDAFFYLSSHEIIGLFFLGLSLHCFIPLARDPVSSEPRDSSRRLLWQASAGILLLLCAFMSKEPFVACGFAVGLAFLLTGCGDRKRPDRRRGLWLGILILVMTIVYAGVLLTCVKSQYTSQYDLGNASKLWANLSAWCRKDALNHLPWIIAGAVVFFCSSGAADQRRGMPALKIWGYLLAGLLYGCYTGILLPWNTVSYYAAPLGVFFALLTAVALADRIPRLHPRLQIAGVILALSFNQMVCQYALTREAGYQYDTANLMRWIEQDSGLRDNAEAVVRSNAMEPAAAIPGLINRRRGWALKPFRWTTNPDDGTTEEGGRYYLYSPRFHSLDLAKLQGWDIVFLSKTWTMYVRPDEAKDLHVAGADP